MNQSELQAITRNLLKAREKSRVQGAIGFRFASNWFKNWREIFKLITKSSDRNRVTTFDSHFEPALVSTHFFILQVCNLISAPTTCPTQEECERFGASQYNNYCI